MVHWMSTHAIPFNTEDFIPLPNSQLHSTVIDDAIWIVGEFNNPISQTNVFQISNFDTTTHEATLAATSYPDNWRIDSVTSFEEYLCILMRDELNGGLIQNYELCKYSTKEPGVFSIVPFRANEILCKPLIVGNTMYFLNRNIVSRFLSFVEMDLTENKIRRFKYMDRCAAFARIMMHNDRIYLCKVTRERREVFLFGTNLELQKLNEDVWENGERFMAEVASFYDNAMIAQDYQNGATLVLDFYNFEDNQWYRETCEGFFDDRQLIRVNSFEKVGDKYYIIVRYEYEGHSIFAIRVLDTKPTLTELCLLNLVKKVLLDKEKIASVMDQIPITLRNKLEALIGYRALGGLF